MARAFELIVVGLTSTSTQQACSSSSTCDPERVIGHRSPVVTVSTDAGVVFARPDAAAPGDAGLDAAATVDCTVVCQTSYVGCVNVEVKSCAIEAIGAATTSVRCEIDDRDVCLAPGTVCGRRAPGATARATPERRRLDARGWFAAAAALEAESIGAFRILARDMTEHGAPPQLAQRARSAAHDEVRHARTMMRLAQPSLSAVRRVARPRPARTLDDIAVDNAVEGCIRETFGALLATWQARHAATAEVRDAMRTIARDETEHAALSWDIHDWVLPRLTQTGQARVRDAMRAALAKLSAELFGTMSNDVRRATGLPSSDQSQAMLRDLMRTAWSEAMAPGAWQPS